MWPLYCNSLGHNLMEIDFYLLFPGKENNFLNNWNEYKRKAKTIFKTIKNKAVKKEFDKWDDEIEGNYNY